MPVALISRKAEDPSRAPQFSGIDTGTTPEYSGGYFYIIHTRRRIHFIFFRTFQLSRNFAAVRGGADTRPRPSLSESPAQPRASRMSRRERRRRKEPFEPSEEFRQPQLNTVIKTIPPDGFRKSKALPKQESLHCPDLLQVSLERSLSGFAAFATRKKGVCARG